MSIDTVNDLPPRVQYTAAAAQTIFPYTFPIFQDADLVVEVDGGIQTLTTDYAVSGEGDDTGGNVTFTAAMTGGEIVTIYRDTVIERTADFQQNGPFFSAAVNDEFDRLFIIAQELKAKLGRAIRFPFNSQTTDAQQELNPISNWFGKFLRVSAAGVLEAAELISSVVPLTQSVIGMLLNPQTSDEAALTLAPVNFAVPSHATCGEVRVTRYGTLTGNAATNNTIIQNAILVGWRTGCPVVFTSDMPKPTLVTGLTHVVPTGERDKILHLKAGGYGEPFATGLTVGAILKRTTNGPVLSVTSSGAAGSSTGTFRSENIYYDGDSTTQVVYLEALYGQSFVNRNIFFQHGTGHGLQIDYMATSEVLNNYALNDDFVTFGLGAARTGIGIYIRNQVDSGLQVIRRNTSRGFLTAYKFGDASGNHLYMPTIEFNEASVVYNGMHLTSDCRSANCFGNYLEGGEGGFGILDEGDYNRVENNFVFPGFGTLIDLTAATKGNICKGNTLSAASVANTKLIKVSDSGNGKIVRDNHLSFSGSGGSVAGVVGITLAGISPRVEIAGNTFDPPGKWTGGAGTVKTSDVSTSGGQIGIGYTEDTSPGGAYPLLSRGALALGEGFLALADAQVSSNILSFGGAGLYIVTMAGAKTITQLAGPANPDCREVTFRTTNANASFTDSANMLMDGNATFTGPGLIKFLIRGGIALEVHRSVL